MTVHAATENHGIWFRRTDVIGVDAMVPARWDAVRPTALCTKIENPDGTVVSTIEHNGRACWLWHYQCVDRVGRAGSADHGWQLG